MAFCIPIFYFTKTDIFLGTGSWQVVLLRMVAESLSVKNDTLARRLTFSLIVIDLIQINKFGYFSSILQRLNISCSNTSICSSYYNEN